MFSEYRDLISRLKTSDPNFAEMFDRHDELDRQIADMESGVSPHSHHEIEVLKKEKLHLKDRVYTILRQAQ
ncbi:hypothetical protein CCR84_04495 [Rhodocyclus purpureus]|nr:hypothetical protein [Rhodocyclus purpureus]